MRGHILNELGNKYAEVIDTVSKETLVEYIEESNHNSWDGWHESELAAFASLMTDILTYNSNK